jgi:cell division protein FtsI (penicillin-binding protein 3)
VGAIKLALRVGAPRFHTIVRDFGIGQVTGIPLPGEKHGLLPANEPWSLSSLASISMGQEVSVTPVQMVSAISAVANGGMYYRPTIVKDVDSDKPDPLIPGPDSHRVTDEQTAAAVKSMMEAVVIRGTGMPAKLEGYTAGGKSGTAQMIDPVTKRYSATNYTASFVGIAPISSPAVTILVVLDSPSGGHMGGEVAGPVFKRIAQQVLTYMGVPHDLPSGDMQEVKNFKQKGAAPVMVPVSNPRDAEVADHASFAAMVQKQPQRQQAVRTAAFGDEPMVAVPNLVGQSVRSVTETCSRLGLAPELVGEGVAVEQYPDAGTQVPRGSPMTVRFGRSAALLSTLARGSGN